MIAKFSKDKNYVIFLCQTGDDLNKIKYFPGLLRDGTLQYSVAIKPIVYNLIQRLKLKVKSLELELDLKAWLDEPFKLSTLPNTFKYHTAPLNFQEIALRYLYTLGSAGLLLAPGMGKSKVVLDYIFLKQFTRSIIVCPAPLLFVWEDEIRTHRPELSFYIVESTDWNVEKEHIQKAQVCIINYNKAVILKSEIKAACFEFIHIDEFLIKDPKTDRTKALTDIAANISYRCGGSGTLVNNTPLDIFSPVRYLQPSLVGYNYYTFFQNYSVLKKNKEGTRNVVVGYRNKDEIRSILESCSIVMSKEVWLKLPPKNFVDIRVPMSPNQEAVFNYLARNRNVNLEGHEVTVDNALALMAKLYQISQGFLYVYPESPVEVTAELMAENVKAPKKSIKDRKVLFFKEQPKITALKNLVEDQLRNKKAIIWFNLSSEGTLITELLTKLGHQFLMIKGGDKKIGDKVRQFNTTTNIQWLVCQAKAVNYGITVLGKKGEEEPDIEALPGISPLVHTQVFYSLNFSLEVYLQQQDRIHRLGQTQQCDYYRLFVINALETKLYQAMADKMSLRREMLIDFAEEILQTQTPNKKGETAELVEPELSADWVG